MAIATNSLTVDDAYVPWSVRKFYWVDSISTITAPTLVELQAGTDLSETVTDNAGWSVTGTTVDSQSFVGAALKLAGPPAIDDSSLTTRCSQANPDARDLYGDIGTKGFVVVFPEGDETPGKMNLFKVISNGSPLSPGIADPATITTTFAVTAYAMRVDIPTT